MTDIIHKIYITSFFVIGILSAVLISVDGFSYYSTTTAERPFHSQHNDLKPSGFYGHGYGIIGSLMMISGVAIYMVRKRIRKFHTLGYLRHWLEFHIFLCTTGPLLILYHTSFKFGGIVAVSFWSMTAVVLSGFIGRFLYVQIPRTIRGQEIDIKQLEEENEILSANIKMDYSPDNSFLMKISEFSSVQKYRTASPLMGILIILQDIIRLRRFTSGLKKDLSSGNIPPVRKKELLLKVKQQIILRRRIGLLHSMQRLFRYWHILHLPFAIVMFVIMFIHIAVTIIFGYRWIF